MNGRKLVCELLAPSIVFVLMLIFIQGFQGQYWAVSAIPLQVICGFCVVCMVYFVVNDRKKS